MFEKDCRKCIHIDLKAELTFGMFVCSKRNCEYIYYKADYCTDYCETDSCKEFEKHIESCYKLFKENFRNSDETCQNIIDKIYSDLEICDFINFKERLKVNLEKLSKRIKNL